MRIDRVNEVIKRELGLMFMMGTISDPRVRLVTILNVDVSKDLQHARVRFSVLSDDPLMIKQATEGLKNSSGFIRKTIASRIVLRYTPEFQFIFDKGVSHAAKVDATLEEIKKNLNKDKS